MRLTSREEMMFGETSAAKLPATIPQVRNVASDASDTSNVWKKNRLQTNPFSNSRGRERMRTRRSVVYRRAVLNRDTLFVHRSIPTNCLGKRHLFITRSHRANSRPPK
jgi:hypothetical protein